MLEAIRQKCKTAGLLVLLIILRYIEAKLIDDATRQYAALQQLVLGLVKILIARIAGLLLALDVAILDDPVTLGLDLQGQGAAVDRCHDEGSHQGQHRGQDQAEDDDPAASHQDMPERPQVDGVIVRRRGCRGCKDRQEWAGTTGDSGQRPSGWVAGWWELFGAIHGWRVVLLSPVPGLDKEAQRR